MPSRVRDACVASAIALLLAVLLTWPLAARIGSAGRVDSGDGRHGVWNVTWVAHALSTSPASLFDANIFHPHESTLAYSEANLVAGIVALPVWVLTGNPYASFNTVVLLAFAGAALSAYLLVRVLGGSRLGAAIAGIMYGFTPYMFAHTAHIQLLMTFGPALSMAALHHFTKAPSLSRGLLLGLALATTALACAYYGIFAGLMTGVGLVWNLVLTRRLRDSRFWIGFAAAVLTTLVIVGPFFIPYLSVREAGFERSLHEARLNSTNGTAYLASAVHVHRWMLPWLGHFADVLFPGFLAIALAGMTVVVASRSKTDISRPVVALYVIVGLLAFWASLGPGAGLYTLLYHTVPAFGFLRAPVRFGVLVVLAIAVLAGLGVTRLERRLTTHRLRLRWRQLAAGLIAVVLVESWVGPLQLAPAPTLSEAHRRLAVLPRAPVAEFPFFATAGDRHRHTEYMLASTFHWQPLINGYSDHVPADYVDALPALRSFPSPESWQALGARQVRWIVVHFNDYEPAHASALRQQLLEMTDRIRVAVDDPVVSLYEVIWPMPQSAAWPVRRPDPQVRHLAGSKDPASIQMP